MHTSDIVFVGGGLAAAAAAETYRKSGGDGSVTIFTQEPRPPVHRPPLSKGYLQGKEALDSVFVHPLAYYSENQIDLRLEARVDAVDPASKRVTLASGEKLGYGQLVLATGAKPRRLRVPGSDLPGVYYLRSLESCDRLRTAAASARHAVMVGAGFIGMEVAASLSSGGVGCTVVDVADRIWAGIVPEPVSRFIQRYYEDRGVRFRFGASVKAIGGTDRVRSVKLKGGENLEADLVVAGVGVELNTGLAEAAGLQTDRGVVVDEFLRTSDRDVYAIGDIANFPDPIGGRGHIEHWDNALRQGQAMGKTLAVSGAPYEHVAYFFSDMFDLSLNMVGYPAGWDDVIFRGDVESGKFTVIYHKDGVIRAALMLNDDAHMDTWTKLMQARQPTAKVADKLADPRFDPKELQSSAPA